MRVKRAGLGGGWRRYWSQFFFNTFHIDVVVNVEILEDFAGYPRHRKGILRVRGFLNYGG